MFLIFIFFFFIEYDGNSQEQNDTDDWIISSTTHQPHLSTSLSVLTRHVSIFAFQYKKSDLDSGPPRLGLPGADPTDGEECTKRKGV